MKLKILALASSMSFLFSCSRTSSLSDLNGLIGDTEAIVINSLGESLSAVIRSDPRQVINNLEDTRGNILNTGSAPNQILVREGLAYIVNSMSNNLQVISLDGLRTITEVALPSMSPYFMTFYGEDRIYVTTLLGDYGNGNVAVIGVKGRDEYEIDESIEMPKGNELEPFSEGSKARPQGICVSAGKIYVTLTNLSGWTAGGPGFVVVIDPDTNTIVKKIKMNGLNTSLAYCPTFENRVYVLNTGTFTGDGVVDIIDSGSDSVIGSVGIGGAPYSITLTGKRIAYVTDALGPHLLSFDANDFTIRNSDENPITVADPSKAPFNFLSYIDVNAKDDIFALAFNSDELYIIDTTTDRIKDGPYLLGDGPIGMVLDK